jgi:hypothetical protein
MNERFRLFAAILISLLLHLVVLAWIMHLAQVRVHDGQGILQVFLMNETRQSERPVQLPVGTAAPSTKAPQLNPAPKPLVIPVLPHAVGKGTAPPPPDSLQEEELMKAMHIAQLAQQRESERAAVMAGLSNLAAQLRPVLHARIECVQLAAGFECTPEPEERTRPLLMQFFNLAIEAHRLGVTENPLRLEFGPEQVLSVTLRH